MRRALAGLGLVSMNDAMPGPGVPSGLSSPTSYEHGWIHLIDRLGEAYGADYRTIYLSNPWVYAGVNYVSRGIGRLPLHVYSLNERAEKTRLRSDTPQTPGLPSGGVQLDALLRRPAGRIARSAFYQRTLKDRMVQGNALWEIEDDGRGSPGGLRAVSWRLVLDIEQRAGEVLWYSVAEDDDTFGVGRRKRRLYPEQVVHFGRGSDPNRAGGVSFLSSCHHTLALHEAVMRHLGSYIGNSIRPSGYFKVEDEKQAQAARKFISQLYAGPENAGKPIITSAEWKGMADSPEHAQLIQLIKESRIEIAASLQIPPPILGLLENAIRANVKELREQFGRDTIGPHASEFEDDVDAQLLPLVPSWSSLFVEFQLAEQLRPDLEARALVYQRLMHIYTIDEIRGMENLPPLNIAGVTDRPWVASGAMPLTTAAEGRNRGGRPPADPPAALEDGPTLEQAAQAVALADALAATNGHEPDLIGAT